MSRPRVILERVSVLAEGVKNSIKIDSADLNIELEGDLSAPGANMTYGTDGSGVKGWKADTSGTIANNSITNAKLVNVSEATLKGRAAGAGTGSPQDLTASQTKTLLAITGADVSNTPAGNIAATTVQAAINELDTEKQPLDSDLTAISALSPSNDDIIQRKSGVWTNRTMAQVKSDLSLSKSDVGLGNVDNTSDTNKPVSTAQNTAITARLALSGGTMTGAIAMGANKITGLANGTNSGDAVNKDQLDLKVTKSGDTMSGALAMGGYNITGLANGVNPQDAATVAQLPSAGYIFTTVNIGDWDMDANSLKSTAHGLSDHKKIRSVFVTIRDDADTNYYSLTGVNGSIALAGGLVSWDATNINMGRVGSGAFDNTNFDSTSYNRGYILIISTP